MFLVRILKVLITGMLYVLAIIVIVGVAGVFRYGFVLVMLYDIVLVFGIGFF